MNNFLIEDNISDYLLQGINAPLHSFSSRADTAFALGLIQENEHREISVIRKIRNEYGHTWQHLSFENGKIAEFCKQLPCLGPAEFEGSATL